MTKPSWTGTSLVPVESHPERLDGVIQVIWWPVNLTLRPKDTLRKLQQKWWHSDKPDRQSRTEQRASAALKMSSVVNLLCKTNKLAD